MKGFIKNTFFALLVYVAIIIYFKNNSTYFAYDFLISLLFFVIWYFCVKTDNLDFDEKIKKYSIGLSMIFSIILSVGNIVSYYTWLDPKIIFTLKNLFLAFVMVVGFYLLLYRLFLLLFKKVTKIDVFTSRQKVTKKYFFFLWIFIFLAWIPYFLRFFPALMSPDSYYVIRFADEFILSDLHTFGHTWFFGAFYHLGKLIFDSVIAGIAVSTMVQMLLLSLIFAFSIFYLWRKGLNKYIVVALSLFFALSPLHAHFSITLWRDVLFGAAFLPITICIYECISNNYKLNWRYIVLLFISTLFILFFRNNGIYVFILSILLLIVIFKKRKLWLFIFGLFTIIFYYGIKGPIFSYFDVASTKSIEAYSIPLQQIARTITLDGKISEEEKQYLSTIIQYDKVSGSYRNIISDPIKNLSDGDKISANLAEFLKNWGAILLKNPQTYVEAYLLQTIGYWYPTVPYGAVPNLSVSMFDDNIKNYPVTNGTINKIIDFTSSRSVPFNNFIWSIGTYFVIFVLAGALLLFKFNFEYFSVMVPILMLWITIMISTPVFAELRYIYGLFVTLPFLSLVALKNFKTGNTTKFLKNNKKNK